MNKRYDIKNTVLVKKKNKTDKLQKFAVVFCIIYLIMSIMISDGVKGIDFAMIGLLLYNLGRIRFAEYIAVECPGEVIIKDTGIEVFNYNVEMDAPKWNRDEHYTCQKEDITRVEYNSEEHWITIDGKMKKQTKWLNRGKTKNEKAKFVRFYLSEEQKQDMTEDFKTYLQVQI